jgi:hypothetical protein
MRRVIAFALLAFLLAAPAAHAQHWNDSGPGRDLLSSTVTDFEAFRQRTPAAAPGIAAPAGQQLQPRGPIPILDWVPPPAAQPAPRTAQRRPATRRASVPRDPAPVRAEPAPVSAPRPAGADWERTLAERERELDRLRRILEEDRLRYERSRQPQLQ